MNTEKDSSEAIAKIYALRTDLTKCGYGEVASVLFFLEKSIEKDILRGFCRWCKLYFSIFERKA